MTNDEMIEALEKNPISQLQMTRLVRMLEKRNSAALVIKIREAEMAESERIFNSLKNERTANT